MSESYKQWEEAKLRQLSALGGARRKLAKQQERIAKLEQALQEVADCKLFETYDPTNCTEEVYETVRALIQDARAALQEGEGNE